VTPRRGFADLNGLLGDHGAIVILLHAAVERDRDDYLVVFEHGLFLL
jgi:hypothetical protein